MRAKGIGEEGVANLDESGLRVFALHVMTLHWRGDPNVPMDKAFFNKLCLSIVITILHPELHLVWGWYSGLGSRVDLRMEPGVILVQPRCNALMLYEEPHHLRLLEFVPNHLSIAKAAHSSCMRPTQR